jgi:hypothetical protein
MFKKIGVILILAAVILSACTAGTSGTTGTTDNAASTTSGTPGAGVAMELPASTKLSIGTMQLEGTDNQVTVEQAATLLPLWQLLKSLSSSDTAAQAEKDAALTAIQATMTAEQLAAIDAMTLSPRDMFANAQDPSTTGTTTDNGGMVFQGGDAGGSMPAGGPPADAGSMPAGGPPSGGGPGMAGAANMTQEQIATAQAARQAGGMGGNTMAFDAVIAYLQGKINPAATPTP